MTQEEKFILLKDLCGRLPYGVICEIDLKPYKLKDINKHKKLWWFEFDGFRCLDGVKPYLRPMSSMTKEELFEVQDILGKGIEICNDFISIVDSSVNTVSYHELQAVFEWFNSHHFDYRGLIPKDLAIAVTEDNNPYKD